MKIKQIAFFFVYHYCFLCFINLSYAYFIFYNNAEQVGFVKVKSESSQCWVGKGSIL